MAGGNVLFVSSAMERYSAVLHLDYLSCFLTIASTMLVGRRKWQGWVVAAVNSVIISIIGIRTGQMGFVPANLFCLAMYAYNVFQWTSGDSNRSANASDRLSWHRHVSRRSLGAAAAPTFAADESSIRKRDRIRRRSLPR